jgi:hypothetical protein
MITQETRLGKLSTAAVSSAVAAALTHGLEVGRPTTIKRGSSGRYPPIANLGMCMTGPAIRIQELDDDQLEEFVDLWATQKT